MILKKRLVSILILFAVLPLMSGRASAFSDETFEMTIDSRFQRAGDSYLWQTEDGAANINVVVNRNEQHLNVWDVDKAYLSDLESQFVDEIDRQMASMYADSYATVNAIRTSRTTDRGLSGHRRRRGDPIRDPGQYWRTPASIPTP